MSDASRLPEHAPITRFPVANHELVVGGVRISALAARVGSTPFYAYDGSLIRDRVALLRRHLPEDFEIRYAVKANPMPEVVGLLAGVIDGYDVSSIGEMAVALGAGPPPEKISFSGPGKTPDEIAFAVRSKIVINLESERQLESVLAAKEELGLEAKVAVRVNPDFDVKGSRMKMGGGPKQFGVDSEMVPDLLARIGRRGLECQGFHVFSGSQNLNTQSVVDILAKSVDLAFRMARTTGVRTRSLVIGGGFGIPYFPGDRPLDIAPIGEALRGMAAEIRRNLPETKAAIELGRYLVGESGVYVCRVIDRKVSRGQVFLVVDGGMNHHLAASGNLGQVIRRNYPVAIANRMSMEPAETVSIVGPLCTPLDLLADRIHVPKTEIGDLIVVFQSGAYGLTASPVNFLSRPHPREILV